LEIGKLGSFFGRGTQSPPPPPPANFQAEPILLFQSFTVKHVI
jgi:hypothetical protein